MKMLWAGIVFALSMLIAQPIQVHAHGAHPVFLSPKPGEFISGSLEINIKAPSQRFPYIHVAIRTFDEKLLKWESLVPIGAKGYRHSVDVDSWKSGPYWLEVQFVGDLVIQIHKRSFVVVH